MKDFTNEILRLMKALKFKYSMIIILLSCLMFLVIFPSFNSSISDSHWSIINQTIGAIEVFLGMGIKHYFDKQKEEQEEKTKENNKKIELNDCPKCNKE